MTKEEKIASFKNKINANLKLNEIFKNGIILIENKKELSINDLISEYENENSNIIKKNVSYGEYIVKALQYNYESHKATGTILDIYISEEVYVSEEASKKLYQYAFATKTEHVKDVNINLDIVF